jgi:hypothetical protein
MLTKIFAVAALILILMVAIKDGRILRTSGLTGSCSVVQTDADGTQLESCRPGKLEGRPDLTRRGCTDTGRSGNNEYWRCPAAVVASQAGR